MTAFTYYYDHSSDTVERGLTAAEAGRLRLDYSEGHYVVALEQRIEDESASGHHYEYDHDGEGEGHYVLVAREPNQRHYTPTVLRAYATTREVAEHEIYGRAAFVDWPRSGLRGHVMTDADYDAMISEIAAEEEGEG